MPKKPKKKTPQKAYAPIVRMQIVEDASAGYAVIRWLAAATVVLVVGYLVLEQLPKKPITPKTEIITTLGTQFTTIAPAPRVCLTLSSKAPDSDFVELDQEFKSLQKHGKLFSVKRAEWDDAGDRLKSYFVVVLTMNDCNP